MNDMKTPKLAIAMNYIRDDLVSGAIHYKPSSRKNTPHSWKYMIPVAACFCIMIAGSLLIHQKNSPPECMYALHQIVQGGVNADVIQTNGFKVFDHVVCAEPQLMKNFYTDDTVPLYTVISDSAFDLETVTQFAENAADAGWFTDYSIEYDDGIYSIINNDCSTTPIAGKRMGGKKIADLFLSDAGISQWLNDRDISVKFGDIPSDDVPAKYFHLLVDGHYCTDSIQLFINDDRIILECNLNIREYRQSEEHVTLLPFSEALKDTFCISAVGTDDSLKIYNAQLGYVYGMPVYLLSGISGDETPVTAYAFAFAIDDPKCAAQIYEAFC